MANVSDVAHRGQKVMVKVLSMAGNKISLSMKVRVFLHLNVRILAMLSRIIVLGFYCNQTFTGCGSRYWRRFESDQI